MAKHPQKLNVNRDRIPGILRCRKSVTGTETGTHNKIRDGDSDLWKAGFRDSVFRDSRMNLFAPNLACRQIFLWWYRKLHEVTNLIDKQLFLCFEIILINRYYTIYIRNFSNLRTQISSNSFIRLHFTLWWKIISLTKLGKEKFII